jgi:two-component system chemotaxis response regulator CheB
MAKDSMSTCSILAIGGSAGALDALIRLLAGIRTVLPFPVVIILHRANSQDSTLTEVLAAKAGVPVKEIEDKEAVLPGVIYLVPADYHVLLEKDRTFSLDASEKVNYSRPSIDVTLDSIVDVYGGGCVGMILSGGNADGTAGLLKIKKAGGIICVQDPETAQVSYMPQNVLSVTKVDRILKPEEMAGFINGLI